MDSKKLGKKIKIARIERDLNQTDLAEKIGAKQKSISRYETGLSMPSIETLVKISKALKKEPAYFLQEILKNGRIGDAQFAFEFGLLRHKPSLFNEF